MLPTSFSSSISAESKTGHTQSTLYCELAHSSGGNAEIAFKCITAIHIESEMPSLCYPVFRNSHTEV